MTVEHAKREFIEARDELFRARMAVAEAEMRCTRAKNALREALAQRGVEEETAIEEMDRL